jgi:adenylate cyclase class 2
MSDHIRPGTKEMPIELELKIKVPEHASVRERLRTLGASLHSSVNELNSFFDASSGSMVRADRGLRLRTNTNANSGRAEHVVTYKGPRKGGTLKQREEIEYRVDDPDAARRIFEALGLAITLSFEKRRESWSFGECKIELDELPRLGCFVEIEGPSESAILRVRDQLGLTGAPAIHETYSKLLADDLRRHNLAAAATIRFP